MIPHDDDIDIVILKQDELAFLRLEPIFNDSGYDITPIFFGYKIISKDPIEYLVNGEVRKCYPWIDVMIFVERNGIYEYENKDVPWYHDAKFAAKDLYPLKDYEFGECKLLGPNNPYPYLSKVYKKWQIKAYIWSHFYNIKTSKYLNKGSVQPHAKPTGPLKNLPSAVFFKLKKLTTKS